MDQWTTAEESVTSEKWRPLGVLRPSKVIRRGYIRSHDYRVKNKTIQREKLKFPKVFLR